LVTYAKEESQAKNVNDLGTPWVPLIAESRKVVGSVDGNGQETTSNVTRKMILGKEKEKGQGHESSIN